MCWSSHHRSNWDWSEDAQPESRPEVRPDPVATPGHLRVSDAERHAVVDLLRQHVGDGRLTLVEFEGRVEEAMAARTGDELRSVLRDLPSLPDPEAERRLRAAQRQARLSRLAPLFVVVGLVLAFSVATGAVVIWPLFVVLFFRFGGRRRRHPRIA